MTSLTFKTINTALSDFKSFKNDHQEKIRWSIKAKIRSILGVTVQTSGKRLDKQLQKVEDDYWNISWSRFYHYHTGNLDIVEWVTDIGTEQYLLAIVSEDGKECYGLLNTFCNQYLFSYIRSLIGKIYTDQTLAVQKSEEITEKTIIRVMKNIDRYSPWKAGFVAWSYSIARNLLRTPDEKTYESTDLMLDREVDSDTDGGMIDRMTSSEQTPAEACARDELGRIMMEMLFDNCGYPWQTLCSGLMKLDYKPGEIVEKYADKTLGTIFSEFVPEFSQSSFRAEEELLTIMTPLKKSLDQQIDAVILPVDTRTRKRFQSKLNMRCSDMILREFFGNKPNKNISDWNTRVLMRLRKTLEKKGVFS